MVPEQRARPPGACFQGLRETYRQTRATPQGNSPCQRGAESRCLLRRLPAPSQAQRSPREAQSY